MSSDAIVLSHVSKRYRLGAGGSWAGDLREEVQQLFRRWRGRGDVREAVDNVDALDDVSLRVRAGENVALIGPNGAGKSTVLRLLSRITRPSAGEIEVTGRVAALIQVGAGFHRELTGRENVFLYGMILGLSRRQLDERYDSIVEFAGLERFMDTPVKKYSSGMYVRLGFSVAVHVEPDVLLIDEVLAVGDREFREKCLARMRSYSEGGTTLVFVSHERALVESVCDRAILLEHGKVAGDGAVREVWDAYEGGGA